MLPTWQGHWLLAFRGFGSEQVAVIVACVRVEPLKALGNFQDGLWSGISGLMLLLGLKP